MTTFALDFEKPLLELEQKLAELKRHAATGTGSGDTDALDGEIRRLVDLRPGLVVPRHETGHHERLRLRARLGEAALDEQDVEPLLHGGSVRAPCASDVSRYGRPAPGQRWRPPEGGIPDGSSSPAE
jgi:hypothetical protein